MKNEPVALGVKTDGVKVGGAKKGIFDVGGASVRGFNCSGANCACGFSAGVFSFSSSEMLRSASSLASSNDVSCVEKCEGEGVCFFADALISSWIAASMANAGVVG